MVTIAIGDENGLAETEVLIAAAPMFAGIKHFDFRPWTFDLRRQDLSL